MKVYLMRHGEALEANEDSLRPLSHNGREEVKVIGQFLARNNVQIEQIYHSSKLRAEETAKGIASELRSAPQLGCLPGILPDDDVRPFAIYCNHWYQDTLIVSHLPFIGKLASELLVEREELCCVMFTTSSLLCLEKTASFQWCLSWFINPDLLA